MTKTQAQARFARLPKWAQARIERLQNDIRDLKIQRDALVLGITGETDDRRVEVDPHSNSPWPLPVGTTVRFHLDQTGNRYLDVCVVDPYPTAEAGEPGALHVIASGHRLAVGPVSSNYITVVTRGRE